MANFGESLFGFLQSLFKIFFHWLEAIFMFCVPHKYFYKDVKGLTVLITGAGSGLGKLLAERFTQLQCKVILWDINADAVRQVANELQCRADVVDLSSREQIYQVADKVKREVGDVDILINNAGIVTGRKFLECPDSLIQKTMDVNINAHFWTVKSFLPAMLEKNQGHVVNIASSAGLFGVVGLADYCASKFAAVGFDESLRNELRTLGKTGVHTTCVCPYYINTGMFEGVKSRLAPLLDPVYVVDKIVDAVLCNQALLIIPRTLYVAYALRGFIPVKVGFEISKSIGIFEAMDTFRGRNPVDKSD